MYTIKKIYFNKTDKNNQPLVFIRDNEKIPYTKVNILLEEMPEYVSTIVTDEYSIIHTWEEGDNINIEIYETEKNGYVFKNFRLKSREETKEENKEEKKENKEEKKELFAEFFKKDNIIDIKDLPF